jgi:hypothetical protein
VKRRSVVAAAAAGALLSAGVAGGVIQRFTTIPDAHGVIHGCYVLRGPNAGTLRVQPASDNCRTNETTLTWSQTGPTGAQGPQGLQGPQGSQGTPGSKGSQGSQGSQGPQGPQGSVGIQGPAGAAGTSTQVIGGSTGGQSGPYFSGSNTAWLGMKTGLAQNSHVMADSPLTVAGTLSNFTVHIVNLSGAPAGANIAFTVLKNGADTAATCTLLNAQIPFVIVGDYPVASCSDTTHTVSFAAGDEIAVKIAPTASVPNGYIVNWAAAYAS